MNHSMAFYIQWITRSGRKASCLRPNLSQAVFAFIAAKKRGARKVSWQAAKLARFTPQEDRIWEKTLAYWRDEGKTDTQADRLAWRDVCKEFPRLKNYHGVK